MVLGIKKIAKGNHLGKGAASESLLSLCFFEFEMVKFLGCVKITHSLSSTYHASSPIAPCSRIFPNSSDVAYNLAVITTGSDQSHSLYLSKLTILNPRSSSILLRHVHNTMDNSQT
ncbi:hypothetical protein CR513_39686, partial [Mucuna pruriens]